ncbi:MAG: 50S ribosomal protein L7/L12 [uncultured bacterium]|nr:MAG: 50S ribosomal protein L7/L12 [uncultured bacterium]
MASKASKIALANEMLETAERNIRSAKQVLTEVAGGKPSAQEKVEAKAKEMAKVSSEEDHQIIEGVFDGQNMIGPNQKTYPVPANYASKSKLIPGDSLKLTIQDDGSFLYKQIAPIERKKIKGVLTYEDGQYKVIAEGRAYNVLLASITYFKAKVGDEITLVVPEHGESEWGAIENVIPKVDNEDSTEETF